MNKLAKVLVIVVLAALPLAIVAPAGATSCVGLEGVTAADLVAGEPLHRTQLFEQYDFAIAGTVTAIRSDASGATRTTVDVHSGFNVEQLPPTLDVSSDDAGAMNGYPFQHGTTYFIPVQHPGPQGQPHYSFVCDPIFELPGPDAAADLEAVATDNGVTVAAISAPAAAESGTGGMSLVGLAAIIGLAVLALLVIGGVAMVAGRRRSQPV